MAFIDVMVVLRGGVVLRTKMDSGDAENLADKMLARFSGDDVATLTPDEVKAGDVHFSGGLLDADEIVGVFKGDDAMGDVEVVRGG